MVESVNSRTECPSSLVHRFFVLLCNRLKLKPSHGYVFDVFDKRRDIIMAPVHRTRLSGIKKRLDAIVGLALSELNKFSSAEDSASMVSKAGRVVEPCKATTILHQVQKIYKDDERNIEFPMPSLSMDALLVNGFLVNLCPRHPDSVG
jgi:hypothetical protein